MLYPSVHRNRLLLQCYMLIDDMNRVALHVPVQYVNVVTSLCVAIRVLLQVLASGILSSLVRSHIS